MSKKNIVVISDSFKGSATSLEVGTALSAGIQCIAPNDVEIAIVPIADGGEGTVTVLVESLGGKYLKKEVTGPLGEPIIATYGIKEEVAFIEMAASSGLGLVKPSELDPFRSTTFGTGELIMDALSQGVEKIYLGIGGSATNDGGIGMAQALGVCFENQLGEEIGFGSAAIEELVRIDISGMDARIADVEIIILSDVDNPLCGAEGASFVYGRQKGASENDLQRLDALLFKYGTMVEKQLGIHVMTKAGAGAAGGLGAGLLAFTNGKLVSGISQIIKLLKVQEKIGTADLVITGEGRIDNQTTNGKVPQGVAVLTTKHNVPLIAVVGSQERQIEEVYKLGIDLIIDIVNEPMSLDDAMASVLELIENAGTTAYRAFQMIEKYSRK